MTRYNISFSIIRAIGICILLAAGICFATQGNDPKPVAEINGELVAAAVIGDLPLVQDLLAKGHDVNAREPKLGYTALHRAVIHGHNDIIDLLLSKGADVNAEPTGEYYVRHAMMLKPQMHGTPLRMACVTGSADLAELLIAGGADVNHRDSMDGETPLHVAIRHGHSQLVKFLIVKGADVNVAAYSGMKALDYVDCSKDSEITKILLDSGAEPTTIDKEGLTVIDVATVINCPEVAKTILTKNSGIGSKLPTVFHLACYMGRIEIAKLLLSHGVDVNVKDNIGFRGLKQELDRTTDGYESVFLALGRLRHKPEPVFGLYGLHTMGIGKVPRPSRAVCHLGETVHTKGATALHWASIGNQAKMAEFLLSNGAHIHETDEDGRTALHDAAAVRSLEVVQVLLARGADANARDKDGKTPLHWTKKILQLIYNSDEYKQRRGIYYDHCGYPDSDYLKTIELLKANGAVE